MKRLRYVRHSDKEGDLISAEGLERARKEAPDGLYTDLFYGPVYRTLQTLAAAMTVIEFTVTPRLHEPIEEIGTNELFGRVAVPKFRENVSEGLSNLEAVDITHPEEMISQLEFDAAKGVEKMFAEMPDGGFGLAYGHDPIISLAARYFNADEVRSLKTLEWIDFFMNDEGEITVTGINAKDLRADPRPYDDTFGYSPI